MAEVSTKEHNAPISYVGVNAPDLSKDTLEVGLRAIRDEYQAYNVYRSLFQANDRRTQITGEIVALYTGKQPKDPRGLEEEARDWESNFPTLFLAGIVDRIVPNLISAIDSARFLTQFRFKLDNKDEAETKTQIFREIFTKHMRQWEGWRNFITLLCQEVVLVGYAFGVWTDEDDPTPLFARQDMLAVPEGTPQYSLGVQIFAFEQPLLIHEFVDAIRNAHDSEDTRWEMDNCVDVANSSLPPDPTRDNTYKRQYSDIVREGNVGASYSTGAKVVRLGHLLAVEPKTQKVSHFIVDAQTGRLLFQQFDRYESMEEVIVPITLEPGNGKIYGSKGLGRMLANFSVAVDAATNDAVDQVRMGGLVIIKTNQAAAVARNLKVVKPFIVVGDDVTIEKEKIEANPDAFVAMWTQLSKMAEIAAGAYIPNLISTEGGNDSKKTAREATIDYNREVQSKTAFVIRFAGQFGCIMSTVQKRMCNLDSSDEMVKDFIKELKENHFTESDIKQARDGKAYELAQDLSSIEAQQKQAIYQMFAGNPMVDQNKLLEAVLIAMSNPEFAEDIIIPDGIDPTVEAEQVRQQIIENAAIMTGESVPISPRDVHSIHLKVLAGEMQKAIPEITKDPEGLLQQPELLDHINAGMIHGDAHVQAWEQAKGPQDQIKKYEDFFKFVDTALKEIASQLQKQMAERQQQQQQAQDQQAQDAIAEQGLSQEDMDAAAKTGTPPHRIKISTSIDYKSAPPSIRRQIERDAGYTPATEEEVSTLAPEEPTSQIPVGEPAPDANVDVAPEPPPSPTNAQPA